MHTGVRQSNGRATNHIHPDKRERETDISILPLPPDAAFVSHADTSPVQAAQTQTAQQTVKEYPKVTVMTLKHIRQTETIPILPSLRG